VHRGADRLLRHPGRYDEPEGTFPGGKPTCVGPDPESGMRKKGHHYVDIWKLVLDGSGRMERLTHFNNFQRLGLAETTGERPR
jgi:hypothetical protein